MYRTITIENLRKCIIQLKKQLGRDPIWWEIANEFYYGDGDPNDPAKDDYFFDLLRDLKKVDTRKDWYSEDN